MVGRASRSLGYSDPPQPTASPDHAPSSRSACPTRSARPGLPANPVHPGHPRDWSGAAAGQPLTLLHFNDFHGQLEPYPNPETGKNSGGIARLAGLIEAIRAEDPQRPLLLLFAGDQLQGSIRLTRRVGRPDEPSAKDPRLGCKPARRSHFPPAPKG